MAAITIRDTMNSTVDIFGLGHSWTFTKTSVINAAPGLPGVRLNSNAAETSVRLEGRIDMATPADALAATIGIQNFARDVTIRFAPDFNLVVSNPDVDAHLIESEGRRTTVYNQAYVADGDILLNGRDSNFVNSGNFQADVSIRAGGRVVNGGSEAKLANVTVVNPDGGSPVTRIKNNGYWDGEPIFVFNTNTLDGSSGIESIENNGIIFGNVYLDGGDDVFDSSRGMCRGDVYGGGGDDTFYYGWTFNPTWNDQWSWRYRIHEEAGGGEDHLILTHQYLANRKFAWDGSEIYPMPDNVEKLSMLGTARGSALGNELANVMIGNAGNNRLSGNRGDDRISGGAGKDSLFGDEGRDRLNGGDGRDHLFGGAGNDRLRGGAGADTFWFGADVFGVRNGRDVILDFDSSDRINLSAFDAITSFGDLRKNHLFASGDDMVILAGKDWIRIADTHPSELGSSDFVF